ncbi:adenine deaminase [Melghiribacillus thermohalophilus]|uniref:adenine deaminase n=1 Tax=Melghiribacillus thermohalophilus TaxID=1324956 RepID=A0A4R3MTX9_9BACI|nr:adenine deaminase C-terminal domain-containing protein [Melghiribacillus thermohalophilus]TCT18926.1 adenine deaminase [Melghiribacillus thermohalophilus]
MSEHRYRWRNRQLREHIAVVDGKLPPTILLKNATYLNVYLKKWMSSHIWIYEDRIVYVGGKLPEKINETEIIDCSGQYLVPGYIEPHAHPFQLYNPHSLAQYASQTGTTVLVNDNLMLLYLLDKKKAFSLLDDLNDLPVSLYWWARFDSQSSLQDDEAFIKNANVLSWLKHDAVMQGGELTSWPDVLRDDDRVLHWMQETKRMRKPVEGHFPGASENTLTKMKLLGADGDHESITGEEVYRRLVLGYTSALRHSSIRPDLPKLLQELKPYDIQTYDRMMFTTDGSTPSFYEDGIMNICLEIALKEGIAPEEAYSMASYNAAKYFGIEHRVGSIGPGRVAHINFLAAKDDPHPVSVLAKGKWMKRKGEVFANNVTFDWSEHGLQPLKIDWDLTEDDLQFSLPVGLNMVNDVIMKPFTVKMELAAEEISEDKNEAFVMLMDRDGEWRIATVLKGFTKSLGGLVSSYSNTGDFILLGRRKKDIHLAFNRMKEIGGGIVLANRGKILFELPLKLSGMMSDADMETLISQEKQLTSIIKEHGYTFGDPIYTLLFLSSVHLPYIRITPKGILDVKKKEVLFPSIMR